MTLRRNPAQVWCCCRSAEAARSHSSCLLYSCMHLAVRPHVGAIGQAALIAPSPGRSWAHRRAHLRGWYSAFERLASKLRRFGFWGFGLGFGVRGCVSFVRDCVWFVWVLLFELASRGLNLCFCFRISVSLFEPLLHGSNLGIVVRICASLCEFVLWIYNFLSPELHCSNACFRSRIYASLLEHICLFSPYLD